MVGSGGVGDAAARIAAERDFFELWVVADYDASRAERTVAAAVERNPDESRFVTAQVDASSAEAVTALAREHDVTHVSRSSTCRSSMVPRLPTPTTSTWR